MDPFKNNILRFPEQLSYERLRTAHLGRLTSARPDAVVVCGMGGSGLVGDVLAAVKDEIGLKVPVVLWKDYGLPPASDIPGRNPLFIFVSFSGNTEETVSGAITAHKKGLPLAIITTGGELFSKAKKHNWPLISFSSSLPSSTEKYSFEVRKSSGPQKNISESLTPRQATGIMFYALTETLYAAGLIPRKLPEPSSFSVRALEIPGKAWAKKLAGRLVLVYTDRAYRHLGYIWKIKLNETGKQEAFTNLLPELDHNELVSLDRPHFKTAVILLAAPRPAGPMAKRIRANLELFRKRGIPVWTPALSGRTMLARTWRNIVLADWTTCYLAAQNRREPGETLIIEDLKRKLRK